MRPPITQLLQAASSGSSEAQASLHEAAYDELRRLAHRQMRGQKPGQTLHTTMLVHEAYLKLFESDAGTARPVDRAHFFALASRAMRQVLIDHFRAKSASKRGGGVPVTELKEGEIPVDQRGEMLLALEQALEKLGDLDPRLVQVVECLFFGGMTQQETALALELTDRTVRSDWRKARAFLARELQ